MASSEAQDLQFMRLALRQAIRARGRTSPNPLVGAVLVRDGRLVAHGYHKRAGTPHAEINALAKVQGQAQGATLYCTLEPCSHHGRTPPCCEAVWRSGVTRVVVGMIDPNPLVAGRGIRFLEEKGIVVTSGILAEECRAINRPFGQWISRGTPWVIMKAGLSLDGRIAARSGKAAWITNEASRRHVHQLRDQVDAILIGIGTAINDDPSLTTRLPGRGHRDPLRVVLDRDLRLSPTARMLHQPSRAGTLICCGPHADPGRRQALRAVGAEIVALGLAADGELDLPALLKELGRRQVASLLVEGGSRIHGAFWSQGLVHQLNLYYGPLILGADGVPLLTALGIDQVEQAPRLHHLRHHRFGDDLMIEGLVG